MNSISKQGYAAVLGLSLFLLFSAVTAAARPMIESIRFNSESGVDRITFQLNSTQLPSTFALKGDRPRVVFDFPDTIPTKAVKNTIAADGNFVKGIRLGIHRGKKSKTRVVFDLQSNDPVEFEQDFDAAKNILVISVFAPGTELTPSGAKAEPETPAPAAEPIASTPAPEPAPTPVPDSGPVATQDQQEEARTAPAPTEEPQAVQESETGSAGQEPVVASTPKPQPAPAPSDMPPEDATTIQPLSEVGTAESTAPVATPILKAIEFNRNTNRGEIITFRLNSFNPPVVFGIEDEVPRVVCFFKDTGAGEQLRDVINSDGSFVKRINVGKYTNPDNIRVVLDLVPEHNYDLQQVFFKDENSFMIIIDAAGEKLSSQEN